MPLPNAARTIDTCLELDEAPFGISEGGQALLPPEDHAQVVYAAFGARDTTRPYANCAGTMGISEGGVTILPDRAKVYEQPAKSYRTSGTPTDTFF